MVKGCRKAPTNGSMGTRSLRPSQLLLNSNHDQTCGHRKCLAIQAPAGIEGCHQSTDSGATLPVTLIRKGWFLRVRRHAVRHIAAYAAASEALKPTWLRVGQESTHSRLVVKVERDLTTLEK